MLENPTNKRGRKRTTNLYFGPTQENAVVEFLATADIGVKTISQGKM